MTERSPQDYYSPEKINTRNLAEQSPPTPNNAISRLHASQYSKQIDLMLETSFIRNTSLVSPYVDVSSGAVSIAMTADDIAIFIGDHSEYNILVTEACLLDSEIDDEFDSFDNTVIVTKVTPSDITLHMFDFVESDIYLFSESGKFKKRKLSYFDNFGARRKEQINDESMKDGDFELIGYILSASDQLINPKIPQIDD